MEKYKAEKIANIDIIKTILCDDMRWLPRVRRVKSGKPI